MRPISFLICMVLLNGCAVNSVWVTTSAQNYPAEAETGGWVEKEGWMEAEVYEYRETTLGVSLEGSWDGFILEGGYTPAFDMWDLKLSVPLYSRD